MKGIIKIFKAELAGPNLVIMAGVHGDEPCGVDAIYKLKDQIEISSGSLTLVLGSPEALKVNKRCYTSNLNRMFRSDEELSNEEIKTYEYQRSRELMEILSQSDALLDIHSSSTSQTEPFVICEPHSYECAQYLPADIVVSGIDELHPTGTDAFVNLNGGMGICIECGNHNDPAAKAVAVDVIEAFISYFTDKTVLKRNKNQRKISVDWLYKNEADFVLLKDYKEFEKIGKGSVIGFDGDVEIKAPYDGVILFPHNKTESGQEVFVYGREQG